MKSILLIPFLFFSFSFQLLAQSPNAARASRATENMNKVLELSDEQKRTISEAYVNMYQELEKVKEATEDKDKGDEILEIRTNFNNTLTSSLSKAQMEKWVAINSKEGNSNLWVGKNSKISTEQKTELSARTRAQRLAKQLTLSPKQEQQAFEIYLSNMTRAVALRPLAKTDPVAAKSERMKLNRELNTTITKILTDEQKAKMEKDKKRNKVGKSKSSKSSKTKVYSMANKSTERAEELTKRTEAKVKLTRDQRNKYKAAASEKYRALDSLKANGKGKTAEEKAAIRVKIVTAFDEKVKTILTAEQLEKLKVKASE